MSGRIDWHATGAAGDELWLRELRTEACAGAAMSLAVWPARGESAWEWEVLATGADAYIRGDVARTRTSAMRAAESAASTLGLL